MSNRVVVPAARLRFDSWAQPQIGAPYPDSGSASMKSKIRFFLSFYIHNSNTAVCFLNVRWFQEAELLEFTQKLTDKNVNLQSEFSSVELRKEGAAFRIGYLGDNFMIFFITFKRKVEFSRCYKQKVVFT
jgi:hypothetical protein